MPMGYIQLLLLPIDKSSPVLNHNPLSVFLFDNSFLACPHYSEDRFNNFLWHNSHLFIYVNKAQFYSFMLYHLSYSEEDGLEPPTLKFILLICCLCLYWRDFHPHCFLPPYGTDHHVSNREVLGKEAILNENRSFTSYISTLYLNTFIVICQVFLLYTLKFSLYNRSNIRPVT